MIDIYNLQRFVEAQESVYAEVLSELSGGIKRGHWIWYIFPQIAGLGSSHMSRRFSISCFDEAKAYSEHSILGKRLVDCTRLVLAVEGRKIVQILGHPDNLKFRSCMTLFAVASANETCFQQALDEYFHGERDPLTIQALQ